jgi:hypothetical protein
VNRGRDFDYWVHIHVASDSPNPKALLAPLNQHGTDILITNPLLKFLKNIWLLRKSISIPHNLNPEMAMMWVVPVALYAVLRSSGI